MPRDDLRKGRCSLTNHAYHLTMCTHKREPLFLDLWAGQLMIKIMRQVSHQFEVCSLAFVVMPDHIHWLIQLSGEVTLSVFMQAVKGRSARQLNEYMERSGPVWQRGFHDHAIREDEHLKVVARYLISNPVRAGLVSDVGKYPLWDAIWL